MAASAPNRAADPPRGGAGPWLALTAGLWLAHATGLWWLSDPPGAWLEAEPFLDQDWSLHHLSLQSARAFWHSDARLWGYSPYFMAGYPANTIQDLSIKFYQLAALLTPLAPPMAAFKAWVWLAAAAVPWVVYAVFANFARGSDASAWGGFLAALLATAAWWSSLPREMLFFGMVGFPAACFLGLLALSLLHRLIETTRDPRASAPAGLCAAWLACCIALPPLHAQVSLVLALPGAVLLARGGSRRAWGWAVAGVALSLAANAIWIHPLLARAGDARFAEAVDALPYFTSADPWTLLKDYLTGQRYWTFRSSPWGKPLRTALLLAGGAGILRLLRERPAAGAALGSAVALLLALTYFGSLLPPLRGWQCLRFKVFLDAALAPCAAYALAARASSRGWGRPVLALLLAAGLAGAGVGVVQTELPGRLRMHSRPRAPVPETVEWIRTHAPRTGRLLFEESGDETGFFWDGTYLSALLPFWTGHQMIGGPANQVIDRHHVAEFHSGRLFGRPIASFGDAELTRLFDLYNISAIVTFHPDSERRLSRLAPRVTAAFSAQGARGWRVNREPDWFLAGRGRLRADWNRIECTEVAGEEAILKLHWVEGLRSEPPLALTPHPIEGDPIPFIRIPDPPPGFVLSLGGAQ